MGSEFKALNSELVRATGTIRVDTAQQASHKLASLEASVLALQASSAASADCTRRMAMYLEELDGARPQEGQEVVSGFKRVIRELGSVRDRINLFEQQAMASGPAVATTPGIVTTSILGKRIDETEKKIANMEETFNLADNSLLAYISTQAARINELGARHDGVFASVMVQDTRVSALEQHATHILGSVESLRAFHERQYSGEEPLLLAPHYGSRGDAQRTAGGFPVGGGLRGAYGSAGGCCGGAPGHAHGDPRHDHEQSGLGHPGRECHCDHVTQLMAEVDLLKISAASSAGDDPWARRRHGERRAT